MLPPVKVVETPNGKYLLLTGDDLLNSFLSTGQRWDPVTAGIAKVLLTTPSPKTGSVVDAGSNLGAFAIPLALELSSDVTFHCFEMQRIIYYQLCGNIVLNQRQNVHAYNVGLGQANERLNVPMLDYVQEKRIGSLSASAEVRLLRNEHSTDVRAENAEQVEFRTLDSFGLSDVRLMKIDVEGMELEVLLGAHNTLRENYHPPLLLEVWDTKKRPQFAGRAERLLKCLSDLGYSYQIVGDMCLAQFRDRPKLNLKLNTESGLLKVTWEQP